MTKFKLPRKHKKQAKKLGVYEALKIYSNCFDFHPSMEELAKSVESELRIWEVQNDNRD